MQGCMLHYYLFKKAINSLPKPILNELEYTDDLLFNISNFNSSSTFFYLFNPFKKDKYDLYSKLKDDKFDEFIFECIIRIKKYEDFSPLLFIIGMISHNIYNKYLTQYLSCICDTDTSINKALNMLDYFYALKYDNLDLTKESLVDKFKDGFTYYEYMENLIHEPLLKTYSFFCSNVYYSKSYKRKKYFYKKMTRSKTKIKNLGYIIYDALFNRKNIIKAKDYIYKSKVDSKLLNLTNREFTIDEKKYNLTFDELTDLVLKDIMKYINAITDYVFLEKEKNLRRLYNIDDNYKL